MSASSRTRRPVTVPSFFAATSMYWIWSRPWWAVIRDSERVSVHLTGLPSRRATSSARISSGQTCSLPPKPPPTSGAMTRSLCSGMPVVSAPMTRRMWGIWVADHSVKLSPCTPTTAERGSMNAGMRRCCTKRRETVTSASRKAASVSLPVPASPASKTKW